MSTPIFRIKPNTEVGFYFNFEVDKVKEGHGETYSTEQMTEKGIASIRVNCKKPENYEDRTSTNGKFYFVLNAENGEIIYTSKLHSTEIQKERGKQLLIEFGQTAEIIKV